MLDTSLDTGIVMSIVNKLDKRITLQLISYDELLDFSLQSCTLKAIRTFESDGTFTIDTDFYIKFNKRTSIYTSERIVGCTLSGICIPLIKFEYDCTTRKIEFKDLSIHMKHDTISFKPNKVDNQYFEEMDIQLKTDMLGNLLEKIKKTIFDIINDVIVSDILEEKDNDHS